MLDMPWMCYPSLYVLKFLILILTFYEFYAAYFSNHSNSLYLVENVLINRSLKNQGTIHYVFEGWFGISQNSSSDGLAHIFSFTYCSSYSYRRKLHNTGHHIYEYLVVPVIFILSGIKIRTPLKNSRSIYKFRASQRLSVLTRACPIAPLSGQSNLTGRSF
jgi:hypothetical protein